MINLKILKNSFIYVWQKSIRLPIFDAFISIHYINLSFKCTYSQAISIFGSLLKVARYEMYHSWYYNALQNRVTMKRIFPVMQSFMNYFLPIQQSFEENMYNCLINFEYITNSWHNRLNQRVVRISFILKLWPPFSIPK